MRLAVLVLIAVGAAAPAFAQGDRPERPYTGIFDADSHRASDQLFTFSVSATGGYDSNLLAPSAADSTPTSGAAEAGTYDQMSTTAQYSLNRTRVGFGASFSATGRQSQANHGIQPTYGGGATGWIQAAKRTRITFAESSSLQPFLSYAFFPVVGDPELAQVVAPAYEMSILSERQYSTMFSGSVTETLTTRASVAFSGGYSTSGSTLGLYDLSSYSANGSFSYQLAKGMGVHAGYEYAEGHYNNADAGPTPATRNIDVGIDYNRPLSISRKVTLGFGTGSTGLSGPDGVHYHINGNAHLSYEINRSWNANVAYSRSGEFVQSLRAPVFGDSLTVSVGGFATRRVQLSSGLSAAMGSIGFTNTPENKYTSYSATAGLTFGLTKALAFSANYAYYRYSFDNTTALPLLTSRELGRQSGQAGVTWRPSLRRASRRS